MKIRFYSYKSFLIEHEDYKIAIDPGGLFLYYFRMTTVIPKSEWHDITYIFVTHGDPDHFWHADRMAEVSGAPLIFNETMIKEIDGKNMMLGPRSKGLAYNCEVQNFETISVNETKKIGSMKVTGVKAEHGPLRIKLGPLVKVVHPGEHERIGRGSMGFQIELAGKTLLNMGDTLLLKDDWKYLKKPDLLMIPIGGTEAHNTMDEKEALELVEMLKPPIVIPCHYNCPALFSKKANYADDQMFKREVEKSGLQCFILDVGEAVEI